MLVKNARRRLAISTPIGVWKSEEVLLLVFELLLPRLIFKDNNATIHQIDSAHAHEKSTLFVDIFK